MAEAREAIEGLRAPIDSFILDQAVASIGMILPVRPFDGVQKMLVQSIEEASEVVDQQPTRSAEMGQGPNLLNPDLWDGISDNTQREFLRQAEMMVNGTVTVALGTDLRAATVMSLLGAGGIALVAAAASLIGGKEPDWFLICAPIATSIGLLTAAALCARSIRPVNFLLPGARPGSIFYTDIRDERHLRAALIHSAERAIGHNMTMMVKSAEWFECALLIAGSGILAGIGVIVFWASHRGLF